MDDWLYVLVSVAVAAFVGGITNHFAIKMLFHPRNPIYIGKFHVPFTPGLIPKRREDIAESLGNVVADYLVTPEGIQELVLRPAFKSQAESYLRGLLVRAGESRMTVREAACAVFGESRWDEVKHTLAESGITAAERGIRYLWNDGGWGERSLKEVVPGWTEENRKAWSEMAASALLSAIEEELLSADGQRMLSKMAAGMVDKAGGFLGTMAAIFVDEDKLVRKLTPALIQALQGEAARAKIEKAVQSRLEMLGEKPLAELLERMTGSGAEEWLSGKLKELPLLKWIESCEQLQVSGLIAPWIPRAEQALPGVTERLLAWIAKGIPVAMRAIQLPKLVQEQVQKFPVERLEEVILSLSGKEFRAITWLGVFLGGLIGLFQSLLMLLTK